MEDQKTSYREYLLEQLRAVWNETEEGQTGFLKEENLVEKVCIASYPRCGNTFTRGYLESILGIYTGSDDLPDREDLMIEIGMNTLRKMGMKGECRADGTAWPIKSHFPAWSLNNREIPITSALLIVRNPFDGIISDFNMMSTISHKENANWTDNKRKELWSIFLERGLAQMKEYYETWATAKIPVFVIRYEDLKTNPAEVLPEILKFLFHHEDLPEEITQRIQKTLDSGSKAIYPPRKGALFDLTPFSSEDIDRVMEELSPFIKKFGYYEKLMEVLGKSSEGNQDDDWIAKNNKSAMSEILTRKSIEDVTKEAQTGVVMTLHNQLNHISNYDLAKSGKEPILLVGLGQKFRFEMFAATGIDPQRKTDFDLLNIGRVKAPEAHP
eukprot:CAMPEP_0114988382 /NCGR_PEP_ID=MMETSP0216-20121206/9564_1 /TAXON_ID=223996 /ORGANISM="Protocruzia adherens, Strain Boccale" /LENGTH=383 /DNA_ID=CAMNT_0002351149 /DNA_START=111 /DNA_END=1262 /DNA_ORIENTATION=-